MQPCAHQEYVLGLMLVTVYLNLANVHHHIDRAPVFALELGDAGVRWDEEVTVSELMEALAVVLHQAWEIDPATPVLVGAVVDLPRWGLVKIDIALVDAGHHTIIALPHKPRTYGKRTENV